MSELRFALTTVHFINPVDVPGHLFHIQIILFIFIVTAFRFIRARRRYVTLAYPHGYFRNATGNTVFLYFLRSDLLQM